MPRPRPRPPPLPPRFVGGARPGGGAKGFASFRIAAAAACLDCSDDGFGFADGGRFSLCSADGCFFSDDDCDGFFSGFSDVELLLPPFAPLADVGRHSRFFC